MADDKMASKKFHSADDNTIVIKDLNNEKKTGVFKCDIVAKDDVTQEQMFQTVMPEHIANFMDGYNICYTAYGQTGSGKSHTITGPPKTFKNDPEGEEVPDHYGLFPRTTIDIWKKIQGNPDYVLTIAIFEDYCMEIIDLSTRKKTRICTKTNDPDGYMEYRLTEFSDIIKYARLFES